MNNKIAPNNYIYLFSKFIKDNFKSILIGLFIIFIIFIGYQTYNYINLQNINKNSLTYFKSKEMEPNKEFYIIMENLSKNNDFYSVLSFLEIININIKENELILAEKNYFELINNKKLNSTYKSAISAHASYNFINLLFETSNLNLIPKINLFIENINDDLENYRGIKLELKYLLAVAKQDINNIAPNQDEKTISLYNEIIQSKETSSSIKERIKKIHEFQYYK